MARDKLPPIWMKLQLGIHDKQILNKMFTDWYDFADYMKQENLKGKPVIVIEWEYIRS